MVSLSLSESKFVPGFIHQSPHLVKRNWAQSLFTLGMRLVTYGVVLMVSWILFDIVSKGLPAINLNFLLGMPTNGGAGGGIFPAIIGTLCLVLTSLLFAMFFGLTTAVYLSEYAKPGRLTQWIRLTILTLSGVPSIVFGLFGLTLFVIFCRLGPCILAGGLSLACMVLPTIIVAAEEAMRAIPRTYREASYALGATQWQTVKNHVLPYAMPGILTGMVLAIGRVAGETAPIIFTAAAFYLTTLPKSPLDQVMALPNHLYVLATQQPDPHARLLQYGTALVLVFLVIALNSIAFVIRQQYRKAIRW